MDVDDSNRVASEYRILIGNQVKYILLDAGTFDGDTLSFPPELLSQLPELPLGDWTRARISRKSGHLTVESSDKVLAGVTTRWHDNLVDILSLTVEERLDMRVHVVSYESKLVVAKIARFEFEIPLVETETAVYEVIHGHGIGPAFLGHLMEQNRVMGFLIEKIEGHRADIGDLEACQTVVKRLHSLGIVHGDLNRHNFIVSPSGVTLIDFENTKKGGSKEEMQKEFVQLAEQLREEMGRGGAAIPESDWSDSELDVLQ